MVIVIVYSVFKILEDASLSLMLLHDPATFCPRPQWKLVVQAETPRYSSIKLVDLLSGHPMHYGLSDSCPSVSKSKDTFVSSLNTGLTSNLSCEEARIANLLGDYIPGPENVDSKEAFSYEIPTSNMLTNFMSLRFFNTPLSRTSFRRGKRVRIGNLQELSCLLQGQKSQ